MTKWICFDVDGTLIRQGEGKVIWQLVNEHVHSGEEINRKRFAEYRAGRLAYAEWVALDIGDWQREGLRRETIHRIIEERIVPMEGAHETITELRRRGYRLAIISGTLNLTIDLLLPDLPFDTIYSNRIDFDEEGRIAAWEATPFDDAGKVVALERIARDAGVSVAECAFIGDSWNDRHVLAAAGFSIAFHPKVEQIRQISDLSIESGPLTQVLDHFPDRGGAPDDEER